MPTEVKLLGWKAEGLRCPDCDISFEREGGGVHPLVLLQMPNGTGKTTTLHLLRATLSGDTVWGTDPYEVKRFRKDEDQSSGTFQVRLLHNHRRLTITLSFDFDSSEVRYETTLPSGIEAGFHPPRDLRQFFRSDFVRLFVFDGELASQLLDSRYTDASRAIEDLFQLGLFGQVAERVEAYWEAATVGRTAETSVGLTRRRNKLNRLKDRIETVRAEKDEDEQAYAELHDKLTRKQSQYRDALAQKTQINERLQAAEAAYQATAASVQSQAQGVLRQSRNPHALLPAFAEEMLALKQHLDRVKLPESASREFFHELAEEEACVCGRPLDEASRAAIIDRASHYLGSDDVALLNALKSEVAASLGDEPAAPAYALALLLEQLKEAIDAENQARTQKELVEQEGVQDDPSLEEALREIKRLEDEERTLKDRLQRYDVPVDPAADERVWSLRELERRKDKAEEELAEVTHTLALKAKRDVLKELMLNAQEQAREVLGREICQEANQRIVALMPHNRIRIRSIKRSLMLEGKRGGSQGETLAVAYAFLATLFNRTEIQLPFVVDSPAGAIDLSVRKEVGRLVPQLAEQFLAFTISSERQNFLPTLEAAAEAEVLYLTLFRKGNAELEQLALQEDNVRETDDGMVVQGRSFFNEFQLDTEDANAV